MSTSLIAAAGACLSLGFGGALLQPDPAMLYHGLGKAGAGARVLAMGEAAHGTREFPQFRNRLFEHLVEQQQFTAIAAETDFLDGVAIDDYVNGRGELTPELVAGAFSFAAPQASEENRQLLEWMRNHNEMPGTAPRLHFYGLEMMGRSLRHPQPVAARPLVTAIEFITRVEPRLASSFRARLQPAIAALAAAEYGRLNADQRADSSLAIQEMVRAYTRHERKWTRKTSRLDYQRAERSALNAASLDADLRAGGYWLGCWAHGKGCDPDQRDRRSAANLLWALKTEGPAGRILLFGHDAHVRKGDSREDGFREFTSLGQHLLAALANRYLAIGSEFGEARGFGEEIAHWYACDRPSSRQLDPGKSFDATLFFPLVTPHRPFEP